MLSSVPGSRPRAPRRRLLGPLLALGLIQIASLSAAPAAAGDGTPLAERRAALERGNVLRDGGFERGGPGWRLAEARIDDRDPHRGHHALRLAAHTGGRAEAAFVAPVLPGLYTLSAFLRFIDAPPPAGGTMADRLHVRVTWLDDRRRPLPGGAVDRPFPLAFLARPGPPVWRRAVFVSSYDDPAGDEAPPGAAFARVRFTLHGPGIVVIDDVRLAYSARNLTLAERIAPYRHLEMDALGRVVPTPRDLAERGPLITVRRLCLRVPDPRPPGFTERAARLEATLRRLGATLDRDAGTGGASRCDATLRLFDARRGSRAGPPDLADTARRLGAEGYALRSRRAADGLVIEAAGADAAGVLYALETVRQLLRPAPGGGAALRAVDGRDWPAFHGRSLAAWEPGPDGARAILAASRWMGDLKLNRLYLNYPLRTARWWEPPRLYRALLATLGERAHRTGLFRLGMLLNPYAQRSEPGITDTFQISRKEDVDILLSEIDRSLDAGARIIMLCLDDFVPSPPGDRFAYHLDDPADRARFGSLARAHLWLIEQVRRRVRARAGATLVIVPPWYNENFRLRGGARADRYLAALGGALPPDVGLAWTGPTVRSRIVDGTSAAGFSARVGGRPLLLWDNSVWELELSRYYAGSPLRADRASLLEPFSIDAEDLAASSFEGEFYFNGSTGGRFRAKAMTLADFLWNPGAYRPERAMWRAMVACWGGRTAGLLVDWDAAYWRERLWINRLAASAGAPGPGLLGNLSRARAESARRWRALRAALEGCDDELRVELEGWVKEQADRMAEASGARPAPH